MALKSMQCFSIESDMRQLLYVGDELILGGLYMLYASNENGKLQQKVRESLCNQFSNSICNRDLASYKIH